MQEAKFLVDDDSGIKDLKYRKEDSIAYSNWERR